MGGVTEPSGKSVELPAHREFDEHVRVRRRIMNSGKRRQPPNRNPTVQGATNRKEDV